MRIAHYIPKKIIAMDQKTIGIVSYITLIGWIIALVVYNGSSDKSSLARFHLRQSLGILATGFVLQIISYALAFALKFFLVFLIPAVWILVVILWVIGLIAAINGEEKPVPVLGEQYQRWFTFIQ